MDCITLITFVNSLVFVLVSNFKVLRLIRQSPQNALSNIEISRQIIKENQGETRLNSIKVMVSRKTSELIDEGALVRAGRKFVITEKGLSRNILDSFSQRSYQLRSKAFSNIQVSFALPQTKRGNLLYENQKVQAALEKLDEAMEHGGDFLLIIKMKENQE